MVLFDDFVICSPAQFRFDMLDLGRQLSAESADGGRTPPTRILCPVTGNLYMGDVYMGAVYKGAVYKGDMYNLKGDVHQREESIEGSSGGGCRGSPANSRHRATKSWPQTSPCHLCGFRGA